MLCIRTYEQTYQEVVIDLILFIQQQEFGIPITIDDQKDLKEIDSFYQSKNGNFWIATDGDKVVGTIGLIDIGNGQATIRKMFVRKEYRGSDKKIAAQLLTTVVEWCGSKGINEIYLGTLDRLYAAVKFYGKNGFIEVKKEGLPEAFPVMKVDNLFFMKRLDF